jgi:mannose-6-phosphate isomerase-like protein (cupin superfamily)
MIEIFHKRWGTEQWIVNNDEYCGKKLNLNRGWRCSMHYHKKKMETFYIFAGTVLLETVEGNQTVERVLKPGDKFDVPRGLKHRFTGITDAVIFEFSTHHEDDDSYRDTDKQSGKLTEDEFNLLRFAVRGAVAI